MTDSPHYLVKLDGDGKLPEFTKKIMTGGMVSYAYIERVQQIRRGATAVVLTTGAVIGAIAGDTVINGGINGLFSAAALEVATRTANYFGGTTGAYIHAGISNFIDRNWQQLQKLPSFTFPMQQIENNLGVLQTLHQKSEKDMPDEVSRSLRNHAWDTGAQLSLLAPVYHIVRRRLSKPDNPAP